MTAADRLAALPRRRRAGERAGIASICSAHPLVIEAALRHGKARGSDVLIEATCNQVNHQGGYTGMTPSRFRALVETIAARVEFPPDRLILGGDHLGPNPWKHLPAAEAMREAAAMVAAYAEAGFVKLHLDTSMGCAGEPAAPDDEVIAARAADLAAVAEAAAARAGARAPLYVIGTEVPVPGGALEALEHLQVTRPEDAVRTVEIHRRAFAKLGLEAAFARAIGIVVQPGVEFGNADVVAYQPEAASRLVAALEELPQFVFEAHSTDYQPTGALARLVEDGFAILKVGPWLSFALREAYYGLSHIAEYLAPDPSRASLPSVMERLMLEAPAHWEKYYPGGADEQKLQRHFSLSDRIRYYWANPTAEAATARLMSALGDRPIPAPLIGQYLGKLEASTVAPTAPNLLYASVERVLEAYARATGA